MDLTLRFSQVHLLNLLYELIDPFVDYKNGMYVCSNCAIVVSDQLISEEAEWRTFEDGK